MPSVYRKNNRWYVRYKDANERWRDTPSPSKTDTKAQARAFAAELEHKAVRQRMGLDPMPTKQPKLTFGELLEWWWSNYGQALRSPAVRPFLEKHLLPKLGKLRLAEVTTAELEALLNAKTSELKPESINHLRGYLHRMFCLAIQQDKWIGKNPVAAVQRKAIEKRLPTHLRFDEVPRLLAQLDEPVVAIFALALYLGLRKGEILGLRRGDVDLKELTIEVRRSYDSDIAALRKKGGHTTKGGHEDLLPIPPRLVPYLRVALDNANGELLFPHPSGRTYKVGEYALDKILRRALGRAGVVTHYIHKCRRCRTSTKSLSPNAGECGTCEMKLWVTPVPRHVRFHDLRHTTATLLLKSGVPLAVVSKIMRHSSPEITLAKYGHLDLDDMREGLARLRFPRR